MVNDEIEETDQKRYNLLNASGGITDEEKEGAIDADKCAICPNPLPKGRTKYCSDECYREGDRRDSADRQAKLREKAEQVSDNEKFVTNSERRNLNSDMKALIDPKDVVDLTLYAIQKFTELKMTPEHIESQSALPDPDIEDIVDEYESRISDLRLELRKSKKPLKDEIERLREQIEEKDKQSRWDEEDLSPFDKLRRDARRIIKEVEKKREEEE